MITQEKMQRSGFGWRRIGSYVGECYSIVVLDKAVVEEALERVVERVVLYP